MAVEHVPGHTVLIDVLERVVDRGIRFVTFFAPESLADGFVVVLNIDVVLAHAVPLGAGMDVKPGEVVFSSAADDPLPPVNPPFSPSTPSGSAPASAAAHVSAPLEPRTFPPRHRRPID